MSTTPEPVRQRRRGPELEAALLEAAWDELVEVGFAKLTMESVAARASTGIAVLYRRWANKAELVLAAIDHYRSTHPVELPDTGTLRGDLLAVLTGMGEARADFFAVAAGAFSELRAGTGLTPTQMRDRVMGEQRLARVRSIYQRAHDRGEIDLHRIPAAVLALPFDLVRHDLLMDLGPVSPARIRSIVDELVLPLVRAGAPGADRADARG
ncbi:MAG TPA: TetR/AcrR family transcriptional regulator [Gryllotalpicola sp.]